MSWPVGTKQVSASPISRQLGLFFVKIGLTWIAAQRWIDAWWGYDVFIAHRRADAAGYASALHSQLEAEKISSFVDRVVYGPGDSLLVATERHVAKSAILLLVGSPELLKPRQPVDWVEKEIETFLRTHRADPKVIIVDFGNAIADALVGRCTTVMPDHPILKQVASFLRVSEPLSGLQLSPSGEVFAAIRQKLDGRRRDRTRLWFFEAVSGALALLLVLAIVLGVVAEFARRQARAQAYANAAYSYSDRDPTVALRLAQQALAFNTNAAAEAAMLRAFNLGSWFYNRRVDGATDAALSADGTHLAWIEGALIHIRELESGKERTWPSDATNVAFSSVGGVIAWKGWSNPAHGKLDIWDASGSHLKTFSYDFLNAVSCGSDTVILPAFASNDASVREVQLQVIDAVSGVERTVPFPMQGIGRWNLSLRLSCTSGGDTIVAVQQLLSGGVVFSKTGIEAMPFALPQDYLAQDVAVSSDGHRAAIFLRGAVRGMKDALGILDMTTDRATLNVVPLLEVPTVDAGGIVQFLDNNQIIVASTGGWIKIVDANSRAVVSLALKQRAADAIAVNPTTGNFAVARRSGAVTIYDKSGFPLGRLVGNSPSDGLNPAFRRVLFSPAGDAILTVSRDGMLFWKRPKNPLVAPADRASGRYAEAPSSFTRMFAAEGKSSDIGPCRDLYGFESDIVVDDFGSAALCVNVGGRIELLPTGVTREEFAPTVASSVDKAKGVVVWDDGSYLRLFVVNPERVATYISSSDEIWSPDSGQLSQLIQ
ncbi:toll/interleukin-1 receptor domain-containing protein [Bradyrhizobium sp. ORS 375]|uniref:toll/interleukin-1 receptor domain-containing protein n=1 Tax=Bradyrhizobium sp. (strain ORS 375) TaxID=566679 RepID=UPI0002F7F782|nr:toll/interleukin-1 receptor domain-containing protein [Bradyrhizobium sp. ORS 375]